MTPDPKQSLRRSAPRPLTLADKGELYCRNCGSPSNLHLHHAIPRSKHRAGKTQILNCIPLCGDCHSGWHFKTLVIYRDVFTPAEWQYLTSVELTGENVGPWLDANYPPPPTVDEMLADVRAKVEAARAKAGLPPWNERDEAA